MNFSRRLCLTTELRTITYIINRTITYTINRTITYTFIRTITYTINRTITYTIKSSNNCSVIKCNCNHCLQTHTLHIEGMQVKDNYITPVKQNETHIVVTKQRNVHMVLSLLCLYSKYTSIFLLLETL